MGPLLRVRLRRRLWLRLLGLSALLSSLQTVLLRQLLRLPAAAPTATLLLLPALLGTLLLETAAAADRSLGAARARATLRPHSFSRRLGGPCRASRPLDPASVGG